MPHYGRIGSLGLAWLLGLLLSGEAAQYAVLIGVDYQACKEEPGAHCPAVLHGPVNDVRALHRLLVEQYQFRPEHITVLENTAATKAQILATLAGLRQTTQAGDFLFLYFSGHGTSRFDSRLGLEIDASSGALVPAGFRLLPRDLPRTLEGLIIGKRDLLPLLTELERERRVLVIFDACFSGNTVRSWRDNTAGSRYLDLDAAPTRGLSRPPPPIPPYFGTPRATFPYKQLIYIAASDETQLARELPPAASVHGRAHGALTDLLLLGLSGAADTNHDQTITYEEIYQFVRGEVSRRHGHTPQLRSATALDRPVFEAQVRLQAPTPRAELSSRSLRLKLDGPPQAALREALAGLQEVTVTDGAYDLLITQEGAGYHLSLANGDTLCRLDTVDAVLQRLRNHLRVHELLLLQHPRQTFNVWLKVGTTGGQTVFAEGDQLEITVHSEREAWLLLVNIDPHGLVNANTHRVRPGVPTVWPIVGPIRAPLGTEYLKLFAFPRPVAGFERWTSKEVLDPATGEVEAFLARIKQEAEWATTLQDVVTIKRP